MHNRHNFATHYAVCICVHCNL